MVESSMNGTTHIDREGIGDFMESLSYPLYFMDFETFMSAIPLYDNARPYQQIPFQYSLHYIKNRGGEVVHSEFLADGRSDPRPAFIEHLLSDTAVPGMVLVYNRGFESGRLKALAEDFPKHSPSI